MMRTLIILLMTGSAFALQPSGTYTGCISADPAALNRITTTPANGAYGVGVDDYVMLRSVRYYGGYGAKFDVAEAGVCFRWMGQEISLDDEEDYAGGTWNVTNYSDATPQDYDTLWVDSTYLMDSVWVTHASDTICVDDWGIGGYGGDTEPCTENEYCCGIVYADTLQTWTDSFKIERDLDYPHFYQVEWFFRFDGGDSMYYDTLLYVTEGDTTFYANRIPFTVKGTGLSGTAEITGWRSAGMDVYADGNRVVTSVDSDEVGTSHIPWSFNWTGLVPNVIDSISVWGISDVGLSSDTTVLKRRYVNLNDGKFNRR